MSAATFLAWEHIGYLTGLAVVYLAGKGAAR